MHVCARVDPGPGAVEASEAVDDVAHPGLADGASIGEDKHPEHEQQRLRIAGGLDDESDVGGLDVDKVDKRRRDAGRRVQEPPRRQEDRREDAQLPRRGNTRGVSRRNKHRIGEFDSYGKSLYFRLVMEK